MSLVSWPKSSCLLLKSPVMIVLSCLSMMPVSILVGGCFCGQYSVVICMESRDVCTSMERCKFLVAVVVVIGGSMSASMLFLCIIATPFPMLFVGCVMVYSEIFNDSFNLMMSGWCIWMNNFSLFILPFILRMSWCILFRWYIVIIFRLWLFLLLPDVLSIFGVLGCELFSCSSVIASHSWCGGWLMLVCWNSFIFWVKFSF